MKLTLMALAVILVFAACNSSKNKDKDVVKFDSTAFLKDNTASDTAQLPPVAAGYERVVVVEKQNADGTNTTITTTDKKSKTATATKSKSSQTAPVVSSGAGTTTAPATPTVAKKKGWSNKAKGAVIGGTGGAIVGAAVSKKKVKGAIIGGVAGAAGGYIIGNAKDKKQNKQ